MRSAIGVQSPPPISGEGWVGVFQARLSKLMPVGNILVSQPYSPVKERHFKT